MVKLDWLRISNWLKIRCCAVYSRKTKAKQTAARVKDFESGWRTYRKRWAEIIIEFNELSTCQNLICIDCFQHWTRRTIYEYLFDFEHCACKNVSVQNELQEWLQIEFIGHSLKLFVCWMASLYVDNMIFQCNIHFYSTQFDDTAMPKYVCVYHSRMGRECYFVAHKLHRKTLRMSAKTIRRLQQYQKCAT